jgi:hypothetical protein
MMRSSSVLKKADSRASSSDLRSQSWTFGSGVGGWDGKHRVSDRTTFVKKEPVTIEVLVQRPERNDHVLDRMVAWLTLVPLLERGDPVREKALDLVGGHGRR